MLKNAGKSQKIFTKLYRLKESLKTPVCGILNVSYMNDGAEEFKTTKNCIPGRLCMLV